MRSLLFESAIEMSDSCSTFCRIPADLATVFAARPASEQARRLFTEHLSNQALTVVRCELNRAVFLPVALGKPLFSSTNCIVQLDRHRRLACEVLRIRKPVIAIGSEVPIKR